MPLAMHFGLKPKDVDDLSLPDFRRFCAGVDAIERQQAHLASGG